MIPANIRADIISTVSDLINFSDSCREQLILSGAVLNMDTTKVQLIKITPQLFYTHMGILSGQYFKRVQEKCSERGYKLKWVRKSDALCISLNLEQWNRELVTT